MTHYRLVIIGGGPSGMAIAYSAYRAGLDRILLLERMPRLGGILNQCIHEGFGLHYFKKELTGPGYVALYRQLLDQTDVQVRVSCSVGQITKECEIHYTSREGQCCVTTDRLVLATGCRERTREMLTIPGTRPAGIFTAGLAQEMINVYGVMPGKKVVIVGSGDIGLIMARRLTLEGATVKMVLEIGEKVSGLIRNKILCLDDFDIPLKCKHRLLKVNGLNRVESILFLDENTGIVDEVDCDTVLFSVGLIPERDLLFSAGIKENKRIVFSGNASRIYSHVDEATKDAEDLGRQIALEELSCTA